MTPARKQTPKYTYEDYLGFPEGERFELIDGVPYAMSPAPSWTHQKLLGELFALLRDFLKSKPCTPIVAPLDVKFSDTTVVQPDITVWCEKNIGGNSIVQSKRIVLVIMV